MAQATVVLCCRDELLKAVVEFLHRDGHVVVQYLRSDVAQFFADQTEVLLVDFQDQLFAVRNWNDWKLCSMWRSFAHLHVQRPAVATPSAE